MPICSPAHSTPPTPHRPSDARLIAAWAALLGRPLQTWQRAVADVATERDPTTGRHAYPRVILLVPRRAGKSLLTLCAALAVAATGGRVFYASAHRENAARMWRDDWFPLLAPLAAAGYVALTYGNGQEAIRIPGAGSVRLVAATSDATRGAATNLIIMDEARELSPEQGQAWEAAAFPTQATGRGGQTWIVSNAGDADSAWLAGWRDRGRAATGAGRRDGLALIEYAAPLGADPADEADVVRRASRARRRPRPRRTHPRRLRRDGPRRVRRRISRLVARNPS